ncbi:MAG: ankyrin repeat domain-containing protein [Pyrinomonadaceae bacterium]
MSKKSCIDSVEVKSPCTEEWNAMEGSDKVRFCSHCSKHVNNLSEMTRKQATRLVRDSDGKLCIRYIADPRTKRPMFADQLLQITRRAPSVAAGVMSASIALSTPAYSQGTSEIPTTPPAIERVDNGRETQTVNAAGSISGRISGTVKDPNGAVMPGASVSIFSVDAGKVAATTSDGNGDYTFSNLAAGTYRIETETAGFMNADRQITISAVKNDANIDLSLEVAGPSLTIDVVLEPSEIYNTISGGIGFMEYGTDLTKAVGRDYLEEARDLLVKGVDPNGKDENYDKVTPLFLAVENGNIEMVEMLINFGAKINARDGSKQTPLMRVDSDATGELIDLLIRFGAKVDLVDKNGNTALILATGNADAEAIKALIDAGADIQTKNKEGQTALMEAASYDDLNSVKVLLEAGSEVNAKNEDGDTALDLASNDDVKQLLISHGAIMSREDKVSDGENSPDIVITRF